jgi:hypothetical protein
MPLVTIIAREVASCVVGRDPNRGNTSALREIEPIWRDAWIPMVLSLTSGK